MLIYNIKFKLNKVTRRSLHKSQGLYTPEKSHTPKHICIQGETNKIDKTSANRFNKGYGYQNNSSWRLQHCSITSLQIKQTKIQQELLASRENMEEKALVGVYIGMFIRKAKYILFFNAYGTFFKVYHILGHQIQVHTIKRT